MTLGFCVCGHMWSSHRKIEGCVGYADPNSPYEFKKLCDCMRFRQKVEEKDVQESIISRESSQR